MSPRAQRYAVDAVVFALLAIASAVDGVRLAAGAFAVLAALAVLLMARDEATP